MFTLAQSSCNGAICEFFLERGTSSTVARVLDTVLSPWPSVLLIVLLAVLARAVGMGLIERYAARMAADTRGSALRSLSHRVRDAVDGDDARTASPAPPQTMRKRQRITALTNLVQSIVTVVIWTIATMMVLSEFGIDLAPMIASAGIVGVALGFGAQDLVKDFLSGLFMLAEDQYGVGDTVDAGEATGIVEDISLRTTSLRSVDGTLWHIPNGEIRRIGNMSQEWARALLDVGIGYGSDIDRATSIMEDVANRVAEDETHRDKFLAAPEVWGVQDLSADAIVLRLVIKTTPGDQFGLARELRRQIRDAFDREGIEIPFPQRTIWVRSDDAATTDA